MPPPSGLPFGRLARSPLVLRVCKKPHPKVDMSGSSTASPPPRSELQQLVRLAVPLGLMQMGHSLMGAVDTAVVGRTGAVQLAGVGLGNGLFFTVAFFGIGLMMGADPLISQAMGAGDAVRARRLYWQASYTALLASLVLSLPCLLTMKLLRPFGIAEDVARTTSSFMAFRIPGLAPILLFYAGRSYLQAVGRERWLLYVTLAANVVNLLGDLLFVFGGAGLPAWTGPVRHVPAMGAGGSALVTSTTTLLEFLVLAVVVSRVPLPMGTVRGLHRLLPRDVLHIIRVGTPIGLHFCAEVGLFGLASFLAGRFGAASLAAHQVALSYGSLTFTFAAGLGNAGSVRVGYAVGALDTPLARRAGFLAFKLGAGFMAAMALVFLLFPGQLVALMTDSKEVARLAIPLMGITALFQVSDGIQGVGAGVLRGAGDTHFTFVANVVGHWLIGLPVALLLGFGAHLGVFGVWWGLAAGLSAVAAALLWRFWRLSSRDIRPLAAAH
jgi:multidrug resistance protein, MATE family